MPAARDFEQVGHDIKDKTDCRDTDGSLPAIVVPRLMRIQDAAKYLSATTWQVETLLREKIIPSFVLGKLRVVDGLKLDRYVEPRNTTARTEVSVQ